jgi:hypothetical protein
MSDELDERTQVEAAQRDPSRFAGLYEQNFYHVYAYVVRRVGDRHQAEDLTADVFREALAGIGKFEWRGVPGEFVLMRQLASVIGRGNVFATDNAARARLWIRDSRSVFVPSMPSAFGVRCNSL